jgi:hypothetical protein
LAEVDREASTGLVEVGRGVRPIRSGRHGVPTSKSADLCRWGSHIACADDPTERSDCPRTTQGIRPIGPLREGNYWKDAHSEDTSKRDDRCKQGMRYAMRCEYEQKENAPVECVGNCSS